MKYQEDFLLETVIFYKSVIAELRKFKMSGNKEGISHSQIVPFTTYSPWIDDKDFQGFYTIIKENTLVDIYRCYELWKLVLNADKIEGDILEVGVWRGGTAALIAGAMLENSKAAKQQSKLYLADTFEGVVKASNKDTIYKGGEHSDTSEAVVIQLLTDVRAQNFQLLKGIFPEEVNLPQNTKLKFCHIDVDTYQSGFDIFHAIWDLMVLGGVVVFDDYGCWGCEGITELCNELNIKNGTFIHNLNGHGIFVKHTS
jgi:O-methyltransferase